jgi:hypothetical protein
MYINSQLSTCVGTQSPKYIEMAQGHISLSGSRHQYLTIVELLLSLAFLRPVSAEDDVDFSVNVRESSSSSFLLLLGLSRFS